MKNEALIAVAGAGKTEGIVQRSAKAEKKTLFITYTSTGQEELKSRLTAANPRASHEVCRMVWIPYRPLPEAIRSRLPWTW